MKTKLEEFIQTVAPNIVVFFLQDYQMNSNSPFTNISPSKYANLH